MTEIHTLENYIQSAEKAFEQEEYIEGKSYLEHALQINPKYGKAHSHLGWLYLFHLNDWKTGEKHLKLAMKFDPDFNGPYLHMAHFLFETGKFEELINLLKNALKVPGIQKSFIYNEYARICEVKGQFRKSIKLYKQAIRWTFEDKLIEKIRHNIKRCRKKRWISLLSY